MRCVQIPTPDGSVRLTYVDECRDFDLDENRDALLLFDEERMGKYVRKWVCPAVDLVTWETLTVPRDPHDWLAFLKQFERKAGGRLKVISCNKARA